MNKPNGKPNLDAIPDMVLIVRAVPNGRDHCGADPAGRLRLLLKRMQRNYGFRCIYHGPATGVQKVSAVEPQVMEKANAGA